MISSRCVATCWHAYLLERFPPSHSDLQVVGLGNLASATIVSGDDISCDTGQGRAHTQTYKYMYTFLPTRPHIGQVRRSRTHTYTNTQAHVHVPSYKRQVCRSGTCTHTHTCTQPCLQDRTYGRGVHTQTHKYMYTSLPIRPHIR